MRGVGGEIEFPSRDSSSRETRAKILSLSRRGIEFSLRDFLPRVYRIIRLFAIERSKVGEISRFLRRSWRQNRSFAPDFSSLSSLERTGIVRGFLPFRHAARHVFVVSQRFEDQLCADPTKLFDSLANELSVALPHE